MQDLEIFAKTIYGEARGEFEQIDGGLASLIAIGNVIMNRVRGKAWYGNTVKEVCFKPKQFSCWNHHDPNRNHLLQLGFHQNEIYDKCCIIATRLMEDQLLDLTKESNHYHTINIRPFWVQNRKPQFRIRSHVFYKL